MIQGTVRDAEKNTPTAQQSLQDFHSSRTLPRDQMRVARKQRDDVVCQAVTGRCQSAAGQSEVPPPVDAERAALGLLRHDSPLQQKSRICSKNMYKNI